MDMVTLLVFRGNPPYEVGLVFEVPSGRGLRDKTAVFWMEEACGDTGWIQPRDVTFGAPVGVDDCILGWLERQGVRWIHHFRKLDGRFYIVDTATMRKHGGYKFGDERKRVFLPAAHWKVVPGGPWYVIPRPTSTVTLEAGVRPITALVSKQQGMGL
jgi:hypothetical protein